MNFPEVAPAYAALQKGPQNPPSPRYVIVTTSAILSASTQLEALAASKRQRGFEVDVLTEADWGGGRGDEAAENLRRWLKVNYQTRDIEYVLLIGNPDPGSGDVPMKMCYPTRLRQYKECPTDLYYADLTGDWDRDKNGKFGEYKGDLRPGGAERNWEVLLGRIPHYGDAVELDSILAKIIAYESAPVSDRSWRRMALLPIEPSDKRTPGYQLGEEIKNAVLVPRGDWSWRRVYEQQYDLPSPPESMPCTYANVLGAWLSSPVGLTVWWAHGGENYASDVMTLSNAALLNDAQPSFVFQCSCLNAYPESSVNLGFALLRNGAICTVAATRVSWYLRGLKHFAGSPTNAGMAYEYAKRVVGDGCAAGLALQNLRLALPAHSQYWWMNDLTFNVYGCPDTTLYGDGAP
jgi:hypothetical protein